MFGALTQLGVRIGIWPAAGIHLYTDLVYTGVNPEKSSGPTDSEFVYVCRVHDSIMTAGTIKQGRLRRRMVDLTTNLQYLHYAR